MFICSIFIYLYSYETVLQLSLFTLSNNNDMADNKNIQDGRDRSKVNGNEGYELSYLEEKFGISRDKVKKAIAVVGNSREKVEEYLKNRR
jgi:hypothetical protein